MEMEGMSSNQELSVATISRAVDTGHRGVVPRLNKAKIFEHYNTEHSMVNFGNFKAQCKYCFLFISASTKTTSNLLTHLKRKHKEEYYAYFTSSNRSLLPSNPNKMKYISNVTSQSENHIPLQNSSIGMPGHPEAASYFRSLEAANIVDVPPVGNDVRPGGTSISNVSRQVLFSEVASTVTLQSSNNIPSSISNYVTPYMYRRYLSNQGTTHVDRGKNSYQHQATGVNNTPVSPPITVNRSSGLHKDNPKQMQFTKTIVCMVAENLLPLSVIETASFKELVRVMNSECTIPSLQALTATYIPRKRAELQTNLVESLNSVLSVCLTFDMWSYRTYSFIGMTIQFIRNCRTCTALLACKRSPSTLSNAEVLKLYQETLFEFNLSDKVENVVTGSTYNEMKSLKVELPGFEGSTDSPEGHLNPEANACFHFNPDQFIVIPERLPCFAKTLQLCVMDGTDDLDDVKVVLEKACSFLNAIEVSEIPAELLALKPTSSSKRLVPWNYQLKALRWLLNLPASVLLAGAPQAYFTSGDRMLIQEIIEVLEPFEDATDYILKNTTASVSYVIPCIRGLQHFLQTARVHHVKKLVQQLSESTMTWFASYEFNDTYLLAAVLDPRFKCNWCQENDLIKCMQLLEEKGTQLTTSRTEGVTIKTEENFSITPSKKMKLFDFMTEGPDKATNSTVSLTQEIKNYIHSSNVSLNTSTLDYWRQNQEIYPTLAKIAQNVLCIPAISAQADEMFQSVGRILQQPEHGSMSEKTFEDLLIIHCNMNSLT